VRELLRGANPQRCRGAHGSGAHGRHRRDHAAARPARR
jgi:hypothetical protein